MVAFNRRCKQTCSNTYQTSAHALAVDESNLALKAAIDAGDLGKVHLFRSWTADVYDPSGTSEDFLLQAIQQLI